MKGRSRFEKLARGCFGMSLSLAEWLELEQMLATSRKARRMFRQRARRRVLGWQTSLRQTSRLFPLRFT
jgi:hypothetical protein